jgi:hypothetical protein
MTDPFDDGDRIISYLDGEMRGEERARFEQNIAADSSLRNRVENFRTSIDAVKQYGLAKQVSSIHAEMMESRKTLKPAVSKVYTIKKVVRYAVAIAASVLFVIAGVQGYKFYQLSPDALYNESFVPYHLPNDRGEAATAVSKIEAFYQAQQLDSVIKTAKKQVILSDIEALLTGLAHMQAGDTFWAIKPLKTLSQSSASQYRQDADFYLALAYLKNRDYDYALTVMQRIKGEKDHLYQNQFSDEIIDKVQMLKWR